METFYGHEHSVYQVDACTAENFVSSGFDKKIIYWKTQLNSSLIYSTFHDYSIDHI